MPSSESGDSTAADTHSLGDRLRSRRRALRLSLAVVADKAGVSEGFLSQLERSRNTASIATLQRICGCLQMTVGELFADPSPVVPHRFGDARFNPFGAGARKVRVTPATNCQLESFIGVFDPYGTTGDELYAHGTSEELLVVISGRLEITVGSRIELLAALDSIAYPSSTGHRAREVDGSPATALWVISPPSH